MESLIIEGGRPLSGRVSIEGAKNAALPACVASLLTDEPIVLHRVPQLRDVSTILFTLGDLGKRVVRHDTNVAISSDGPLSPAANAYSVRQMRASFLVLGPLVARLGRAVVPLPGGCVLGRRPVDLHLRGLEALGARVEEKQDSVVEVSGELRGGRIEFPFPSVGATEQVLMAAALARGETEIRNGAVEPEVEDLVRLLRKMGAEIEVRGRTYHIAGRTELGSAEHALISDRLEAGTYLLSGAITGGELVVDGVNGRHLASFLEVLRATGLSVTESGERITVLRADSRHSVNVVTAPHPGFPTDLHPPLVAYLALVPGVSRVTEAIFERRFAYVEHLGKLGATIRVDGPAAVISGVDGLRGQAVESTDIRAGAALVLAGLGAKGYTTVTGVEKIDRGYACLEEKLRSLGANVERRHG